MLLTCSRHNSDGGVLVIRLKEASLVQACNAVIDTAEKTRERILATLARPDTGSRLLDIIPSLDPFIEIADKAAAVRFNISNATLIYIDILADSSFRQHCMADRIVNYQGEVVVPNVFLQLTRPSTDSKGSARTGPERHKSHYYYGGFIFIRCIGEQFTADACARGDSASNFEADHPVYALYPSICQKQLYG